MNIIVSLQQLNLTYDNSTVQYLNHYTMESHPNFIIKFKRLTHKVLLSVNSIVIVCSTFPLSLVNDYI